jgi:hypothetical protein
VVMDVVQGVHDHHEPLARITGPRPAKRRADVGHARATAKEPADTIGMDIIEAHGRSTQTWDGTRRVPTATLSPAASV